MIVSDDLSREQAVDLVRRCFHDLVVETDLHGGFIATTDRPDWEIEEQRQASLERLEDLRAQRISLRFDGTVRTKAAYYLGSALSGLAPDRCNDILDGVTRALIEQQNLFLCRLEDRLSHFKPSDPLFLDQDRPVQSIAQEQHVAPTLVQGPTVGKAIELYLAGGKLRWVLKTYMARVWQLRYLEECLGTDVPLAAVTSHDIRRFRDEVLALRANHGRTGRQTFKQKQTENSHHRIQPKTAALIFEACKAMFAWSKRDEGMIATNPAEDVRIPLVKQTKGKKLRRPFRTDELTKLFTAPIFTGCKSVHRRYEPGPHIYHDAKFWIPVLGYYTGARLGELVQLHVGDVRLDGPIPYISIDEENSGSPSSDTRKHVKSAAGVRRVPLHRDVLAIGFAEFVATRRRGRKQRLFHEVEFGSDGQASTVASKWFARFMNSAGLPDPGLVFHSFRHLAEDAFRDALQPQYVIDRIIGHSDSSTSARYGEGISLEVASSAVSAMALKLRLPALWADQL